MKLFKSLIVLGLSGILLLSLGCASKAAPQAAGQVTTVQRGNLSTQITGVGNLAFSQTVDLAFEINGTVAEVLVEAGDSVKQGQVLARLDTSAWQDQITLLQNTVTSATRTVTAKQRAVTTAQRNVTQAQQNITTAEQGVETAKNNVVARKLSLLQTQINLQNARIALEQIEETSSDSTQIQVKQLQVQLAEGQVASAQRDLDNASTRGIQDSLTAVEDAKLKLQDALTAVDDANIAVADAQKNLDEANQALADGQIASPEVKAPFNGLITNVNVTGGQEIKKGTVAATIADPTKFQASLMVSELNILKLKMGGAASVQVEAMAGTSIPATVSFIAPSATIQSGVVNYQVQVQLVALPSFSSNLTSGNSPFSGNTSAGGLFGRSGQASAGANVTQPSGNQTAQPRLTQTPTTGQSGAAAGRQSGGQARQASTSGTVQLAQGLTVTVSITTAQATDILRVPTTAITTQGGQTTVQVTNNGVTENRPVTTGISNSQFTEITSGLSEGEQIIVPLAKAPTATSGTQPNQPRPPGFGRLF